MSKKINEVMKQLAEYSRMQEELNQEIESLKDEIKNYMNDEDLEELLGENGEHVVWKKVLSNRFDSTAFKKSEWGELYKQYCKVSETRPFKFFS